MSPDTASLDSSPSTQRARPMLRWWRLTWPLPAVLGWTLGCLVHLQARAGGADTAAAMALAMLASVLPALAAGSRWRAALVVLGTPVLLTLGGIAQDLPTWIWLLPAALLLLAYPMASWSDAPFFPTRKGALNELPRVVRLGSHATVLDAGCGLGHGLKALHAAFPQARVRGVERSLPLSWLCSRLCPWAEVRRGDMWAQSWRGMDLVYLFQRPESMPRAMEKARRELRRGAWLVSLEFEACEWKPMAQLRTPGGKPVWVYRVPAAVSRPVGHSRH